MPRNFWTEFWDFGRCEPAGIYCRYKKFFIKRNNSQRSHATLGLKLFTAWFREFTKFGIFTNDFIFFVLMLRKTKHSISKEARPVLNPDWMKSREILEIGIREIMSSSKSISILLLQFKISIRC